ncbi:protein of unknown function [uncultured Woeseiaceae bacterium]|uniref:Uncharacterized protein n=1 Tax=uncultured Woeseiaceae bacterium TaxID=1983305 RepID=A0A7D9H3M6_9GAMM|nr:protein of unknown function [uncultured Woeseiaceae bacterium]
MAVNDVVALTLSSSFVAGLDGFRGGLAWRSSASALFAQGGALPVALDVELEDSRVMDQAIDSGERHGRIGKDLVPLAKRLVGGDQDRAVFIACADEFEQDTGFGLIFGDVGEIVE